MYVHCCMADACLMSINTSRTKASIRRRAARFVALACKELSGDSCFEDAQQLFREVVWRVSPETHSKHPQYIKLFCYIIYTIYT